MHLLTSTEIIIAHNVAQGYAEKEIADRLCVSVHTVHTHARNIRKKWNARNIADITRMYILSLEDPRLVLKAVVCLLIHIGSIIGSIDTDVRRPSTSKMARSSRGAVARANTTTYYV